MVFLRAIYNHTRNFLHRYANNFLYPLGISFLLGLLFLASTLLTRWEDLSALYALLMLGLTLIHCVLVFFIAIVLLLKKRILRSFSYVLLFLCDLIVNYIILFFITIAFMCSGPVKDHFIKDNDIKLPKDIELLDPKGNTYAQDTKMPPFAEAIEEALINGPAIGNDEECHIPSLERLMENEESKLRLMHYLEASTEWVVFNNNVDGVYAERRKSRNGNSFNLFLEEDKPLVDFSFQIRLYFDKPARLFARNHKPYECIIEDYSTPNKFSARTWSQAGTASVYIVETATGRDGRKVDGRRITKKITEFLDKEFTEISLDKFGKEGNEIQVKLLGSGGTYALDIWSNQGQPGTFTVKATEITKGIPLSKHRLKEHDVKTYGDSSSKLYYSQIEFTIYEGNWKEYYGARIELWFTPDDGGPEHKVWEANCKIEGWQR